VEHLIDRESELAILRRLARKNIGPRLLGTFINGRFEEYLHATTLTAENIHNPDISKQIAKRMRELHDGIDLQPQERAAGPFVWQNWDKWVGRCEDIVQWLDRQIQERKDPLKKKDRWKARGYVCGLEWKRFYSAVEAYREWLKSQYGGGEGLRQSLVFAHNDVSLNTSR